MRGYLSPSVYKRSAQFQHMMLSILVAAAMLAVLLGLTLSGDVAPTVTTGVRTSAISAVSTARPLLDKPELTSLRSAYARHYDLGNGKRVAVVGAAPLNYQDAEGNWQPIQPDFERSGEGWRVEQNTLRSAFAGDSTTVQLRSNGEIIGWQPLALEINDDAGEAQQLAVPAPGAGVQAEAAGRVLRYEGAWTDSTLIEQFHSSAGTLEQELILAQAPVVAAEGEWLSLRADLALPTGVQIVANGQPQTGEFTTYGAVQFQQADGTPLLALIPPRAYEQDDHSAFAGGRYRVVSHGDGLTLWVQTPLAWWLAAERSYPAVLDPTMQVLRPFESATIRYPYDTAVQQAVVRPNACVGFHGHYFVGPQEHESYSRGYVKFKLPTLPDGAILTDATLVAAPEKTFPYTDQESLGSEQTRVHAVTGDWSFLQGITTTASSTTIAQQGFFDEAAIPFRDGDPPTGEVRPATTWDAFAVVVNWYNATSPNYGLVLTSEFEGQFQNHFDRSEHCFPTTAEWSNLDSVVDNPSNPTTDGPGLGLLIEYISPELANNEIREVTVPSTQPSSTYKGQYHEYALPYAYGWQLVGARGSLNSVHDSIIPNTPVGLADSSPSGSYYAQPGSLIKKVSENSKSSSETE